MNANVVKIKKILESFYQTASKNYAEKAQNKQRYSEDYVEEMNSPLYAALAYAYTEAKERITSICKDSVSALLSKDILNGDDLTRDAEFLSKDSPLQLSQRHFEAFVQKYAGKNHTMLALLRQFAESNPDRYYTTDIHTQCALANYEERTEAWQQIERGALSLLDSIYVEYNDMSGDLLSVRVKGTVPISLRQVEDFMSTPISDKLNALVDA